MAPSCRRVQSARGVSAWSRWLRITNSWTAALLVAAAPAVAQERTWLPGAVLSVPGAGAWPSTSPAGAKTPSPVPSAAAAPSASTPNLESRVNLRDGDNILILVRTSLLTLNDAMLTGNFTVLRDKVAPSVRDQNTPGRLYQTFSRLMEQRIDLRAIAILAPELTEVPAVDGAGRLNLKGMFRAPDGTALTFHLVFESVNGQWLLFGAAVNTVAATAGGAAPQARAATAPASSASNKAGANPRTAGPKRTN
jgi:hypothetical protein